MTRRAGIGISRDLAAKYGRQAVEIIETGQYQRPSGKIVELGDLIMRAVDGTRAYPPEVTVPERMPGPHETVIAVENETTLAAVSGLQGEGYNPVALNFASATSPGGGFRGGARAQEEYLARSSGLYACLRHQEMYAFHRARHDPLYTDYAIYSPAVPVFRSDEGGLLDKPYTTAIITAPAVNAGALPASRHPDIELAIWQRVLKVLGIGVQHGHDSIVLGAWGCGAFGNEGHMIARLFRQALDDPFRGAYRRVVFAIVDTTPDERFIEPFWSAFATGFSGAMT